MHRQLVFFVAKYDNGIAAMLQTNSLCFFTFCTYLLHFMIPTSYCLCFYSDRNEAAIVADAMS